MKRKTKRFGGGGDTDDAQTRANRGEPEKTKMVSQQETGNLGGTGLKRETFSDAFARARRAGDKTFEFKGKTYGTALKGETRASSKASSEPKVSSSVIDAGIAAAEAQKEARNPNSPRLKSMLNVRNMADEARFAAQKKNYDASKAEQKRVADLQSTGAGRALTDIQAPRITQSMSANQADADAAKKEFERRSSMARDAYRGQGYDEDSLGSMKKGGKVKKMASGGKVKSASARADGCAIRGKTRA